MYFVYILQSLKDKTFYIGYTSSLEKRLSEHNSGMSYYTKRKIPWKLVHYESFFNKRNAIKRERELKRIRNISHLKKIISNEK